MRFSVLFTEGKGPSQDRGADAEGIKLRHVQRPQEEIVEEDMIMPETEQVAHAGFSMKKRERPELQKRDAKVEMLFVA